MPTEYKTEFKKVCIVGLGYIGLPTAALVASRGVEVLGVDINQHVVDTINSGSIHIIEPELDIVVHAAVNTGHLRAAIAPEPADVFVVAVPTPFSDGYVPDLSYVKSAAESIAGMLRPGNLIILESTSPVGTTEHLTQWLADARKDLSFPAVNGPEPDIHVAHCPERVLPGKVLHELVENDRIVGGITPQCAERAKSFYSLFVRGECLLTDCRAAELAKLSENAYRDVNIAFANELSMICDRLGINVWELIRLANRHPRVEILQPGPGVGGHCIAVDPWFIVHSAPKESQLIRTAREVNSRKPEHVLERILAAVRERPGQPVACLGLSFKANIDDFRESPAVRIVEALCTALPDTPVLVAEPHIEQMPETMQRFDNLYLVEMAEAVEQAGVVALLVDHNMFREIEPAQLHGRQLVDTRGFWNGSGSSPK